jgi:hypothetical protein
LCGHSLLDLSSTCCPFKLRVNLDSEDSNVRFWFLSCSVDVDTRRQVEGVSPASKVDQLVLLGCESDAELSSPFKALAMDPLKSSAVPLSGWPVGQNVEVVHKSCSSSTVLWAITDVK